MDDHHTAADEARLSQEQKRAKVLVTCSLPQGLVLNNHLDAQRRPTVAANMGPGTPIEVRGSQEVDADFWQAWADNNKGLVERGVISAVPVEEIKRNEREADGEESVGRQSSGGPEQDLE